MPNNKELKLTPELITQGWQLVPEYPHDVDYVELGVCNIEHKYINHGMTLSYLPKKSDLSFDEGWLPVFRVLTPVLPNKIIIDKAEYESLKSKLAKIEEACEPIFELVNKYKDDGNPHYLKRKMYSIELDYGDCEYIVDAINGE